MKRRDMIVELIDHMGSDLSVVNAARVSYAKESKEFSDQDAKLINYLAKHNHWSPFGHASLQFRIKAPIFVARQLVKHQVGLVWNEVSRRYVDDKPEFYQPPFWRSRPENSKQGSGGEIVLSDQAEGKTELNHNYNWYMQSLERFYDQLLGEGVAPEMARMVLPQSTYTEWYWSGTLMAFARVCNLRCKPDTQLETQEVANLIDMEAQLLFPTSWEALRDG